MMKFPIYGKIKHVPNHQPDTYGSLQYKPTVLGIPTSTRQWFFPGFVPVDGYPLGIQDHSGNMANMYIYIYTYGGFRKWEYPKIDGS